MSSSLKTKIISLFLVAVFTINNQALFAQIDKLDKYYRVAMEDLNKQNYYSAAENFKQVLNINSNYTDARIGLAYTYFYLEQYQETIIQLDIYEKLVHSTEANTLRARSLVALGKKNEAAKIFEKVIKTQPNNLDAQFGLAEITILNGKQDDAIRTITLLLSLIPDNRRALLSLGLLHDDKFDFAKGEKYFNQALYYHPYDPMVLAMNAKHYKNVGKYEKALEFYNTVEKLSPYYDGINHDKAEVLMAMGRYDEAGNVLEAELGGKGRNNPQIWASLAYIFEKQRLFDDALECYKQALILDNSDEVTRFAVEDLVRKNYPINSEEREFFAKERMYVGNKFRDNFNYPRASREYRMALLLAPENAEIRFAYARMIYKEGGIQSFIDQVKLIKASGKATQPMLDALESVEVKAPLNLAKRNAISNGAKDPNITISIFTIKGQSILNRLGSSSLIDSAFISYMERYPRFNTINGGEQANFTSAWRVARDNGSNFFVVNRYMEKNRVLYSQSQVYLTATGTLINSFSTNRANDGKFGESLHLLSERIVNLLPLKGYIIKRDLGKAIISLGMFNGVKVNDKFLVLRNSSSNFISKKPYVEFFDEDNLGTITINEIDEFISEGIINSKKIPDIISANDEVFLIRDQKQEITAAEQLSGIPNDFMKIH